MAGRARGCREARSSDRHAGADFPAGSLIDSVVLPLVLTPIHYLLLTRCGPSARKAPFTGRRGMFALPSSLGAYPRLVQAPPTDGSETPVGAKSSAWPGIGLGRKKIIQGGVLSYDGQIFFLRRPFSDDVSGFLW